MDTTPLDIQAILNNAMKLVVWPVLFSAVVIMFVYAGILFATSAGDPSKIATAKKAVIFAVVGLIVGVLAYSVGTIFKGIVG